MPRTVTVRKFAADAGCSVGWVYKQIHAQKIPVCQPGPPYRIPVEFAEGWLRGGGKTDATPTRLRAEG